MLEPGTPFGIIVPSVKSLRRGILTMAKHGEHPEPSELEELLEADVHTIFLKADCPPRVKRGTIGQLKLIELESSEEWDNLRLESLQESLQTVAETNQHRSDCFLEIDRKGCQVLQLGDLRVTCVKSSIFRRS